MSRAAQDKWVKCPSGEFDRLATRLRSRRRLRLIVTTATTALATALALGALALGGTAVVQLSEAFFSPRPTGSCHESTPSTSPAATPAPTTDAGDCRPAK